MRVEAAGQAIVLGDTETTPTIGITDYSRRVTDDFGVTTVVERKFARRLSVRLALPSDQVDTVHARLTSLRASTALWVADDRFASLSVAGFYKDFTIDIPGAAVSFCTLTVEGLAEAGENPDLAGDPAPDAVSSTLRLIQPADVTDAALVAINVPENDAPAWGAGVSYAAGAKVARQHRVYESLIAANTSDPAAASGTWLDTGPTNRWAMFDQALGTSTTAAGSIVATLNVGGVDAVALLDTAGDTVRVQGAGYDRTQPVGTGSVTFLDMPLSAGPVTITVAGSGQVAVGTLLVGRLSMLGVTEASPTAAITDYSRKEVDDFGDVTIVERAWAKRMDARSIIRTDAIDKVFGRLAAVRARPSLWIGQDGVESLTIYGFFKDFSIEVGPHVSKLSLSIEGLSKAPPVGTPLKDRLDSIDGRIDDALGLAGGKAEIFFRDAAPSAAESRANDLWINGTGRVFRRVAGSGALAIGGKRILLAGAAVLLPWTLADDQRIGAALVAAGAAQATAERKTETYISETQPADGTYGDLWFKPSTQELRTFNGSAWVLSSTVGALPEQLEAIEAAADLAGEAKTIADGKARILWRPTAPSATDTDEGDRWVNTAAGNVEYRRMPGTGALSIGGARLLLGGVSVSLPWTRAGDQRIAQALGDAASAQATADGKIETYFSEAVPVADAYGDLWFKPSSGELRRWNGSAWDLVSTIGATAEQLEAIGDALTAAENAQATADGKIVTFFQPEPPAGASEGDLWIDTNAGNALFRYDGAAWIEAQDAGIGAAIGAAAGAQATADGKVTTFVDEEPPVAEAQGDLWFRPSTKELRRWDGDSWDLVATIGATSAAREAIQAAADLADEAKTVADGKARLFYRPTAPAAAEASEGDRWVNTGTGNVEYRRLPGSGQIALAGKRVLLGGSTIVLPWTRADDQRIAASLAAAAGAQATADGKIETYFTETAPVADGVGDLWYRPSTKELRRWSGSAWDLVSTVGATDAQLTLISNALTAANNARAVADGKIAAFYQPTAPAEADEGDLWIDTDDGNKLYRYDGAQWVLTRDTGITAALNAASGAQTTADKKVTTFVGEVAPVAEATGDLWYRPSTKEFRRWDGDSWDVVSTVGATQDQVDAIDAKSRTFRQAIAPSAADSKGGDLWINTAAGNRTYQRLTGSGQLAIGSMRVVLAGKAVLLPWTLAADQRIEDTAVQASASAAALAAAQARLAAVATDASEAKAIADGKIDSFWQPSPPVGASEGDFWIDTDDNRKLYRFTGGAWTLARDAGIGQAIAAASDAQATADGKVTSFIQATPPVAEGEGDFWYDTAAGRLKRWSGTEWVATADDTAANQHSMQDLGGVVFTYNPDGTPGAPGQFPTTALSSRLLGQQDVSPQADWSLDVPSGVNATINNSPGALQRGMITITAPFTVEAATVVVRSTYAGVMLTKLLQIRKGYTSAPATGGGGSGSGSSATPGNPASATSFTSPESSPTRVVMATLPAVAVGGSGNVRLSTSLTFTVAPGDEGDIGYLYGIWAYSTNGGGAWSDVGSATMSSGASNYFSLEMPKGPRSEPGSLEVNVDKTGLTGGASVIFRLEGFSSGRYIASVTGSATAKPL